MNFKVNVIGLSLLTILVISMHSNAEEMALYPTGPSQDSSFLRFVNGTEQSITLSSTGAKKMAMSINQPATSFYPIAANSMIKGNFSANSTSSNIAISVKPGEFATSIALTSASGLKQLVLREQPDDFNALKASIALYNTDTNCTNAGLNVVGRSVNLFEKVAAGNLQRRALNPVKISVQLLCNAQKTSAPLDLGLLQAGQRYSIFVLPSKQTSRLFFTSDNIAQ